MSITPFFMFIINTYLTMNINKIKLSGQTYNIQDENACKVVELTQAEYDALPTSAKTSNSLFVITDATAGDLSNYYTKSETSGATEISTALGNKQDTLVSGTNIKTINNESILGSGNIEIQGGGGKAIEAGRGISITTGETADTVSFSLPISAGTGTNSIKIGGGDSSGMYSLAGGAANPKSLNYASFAWGEGAEAKVLHSTVFGFYSKGNGYYSFANGEYVNTNNEAEHSQGKYNVSNKANGTWGDSGNTLFSVGNGTSSSARHNAFEIRQNGDIYITKDGQDVKLQDQLGGGGSSYTAGDGIDITNDVISVTGKQDTLVSGTNIKTINNESILGSGNINIQGGGGGVNVVQTTGTSTADVMSQDAVTTAINDLEETLAAKINIKQGILTEGNGITIEEDVISVTGKVDTSTYNTYTAATDTALASKQDTLVSGTNIKTINNQSILGEGNIIIEGGGTSITIDPSLDSGSTNPVANSAITEAITANQNAVFITSENRNSIVEHIENDIYDLKTNDIYSISFIPKDLEYTKFSFTCYVNGTYTDVETDKNVDTATTQISITFDSETNRITVTSLDRDANKIDVSSLRFKKTYYEDLEISDVYITHNPSLGVVKTEYEKTIQTSYKESGGYITERKGNTEIKYNTNTTSTSNLVNGSAVNAAIDKVKTRFNGFGQSYKGGKGCTDYASQSPNITDFTSGEHSVTLTSTNSARVWWFNVKLNENSTDTFGNLNIDFSSDGTSFGNLTLFLQRNTLEFRLGDLIKRIDVTDKTQTYSVFVPNGILVNTAYHSAVASYNVWSMSEGEPFFLESIGIFSIPQDSSCLESFDEWKSNVDTDISSLSARTEGVEDIMFNHINDSSVHVTSDEKSTWDAKQDQLVSGTNIKTINNQSLLGEGNITIEGGGGKAIEAGRGISITTGETADTISFNLPISAGTGNGSLIIGDNGYTAYASFASGLGAVVFPSRPFYGSGNRADGEASFAHGISCSASTGCHAEGNSTKCSSYNSHSEGGYTEVRGMNSHSEGEYTLAGVDYTTVGCHAEGNRTSAMTSYSHAEGSYTRTTNKSEHASGQYNNSVSASKTFGDSGNTLFSVGNGTSTARHNAFEIRQNGDIYCSDGTNDVKLQDTITATAANTTALGGLKLVKLTQSEYDALSTKDSNTLYVIVN